MTNLNNTFRLILAATLLSSGFYVDPATAENLLRGPYLQQGDTDSVIIKWRSDVATDSKIEFGSDQGSLNLSVVNSNLTTDHEIEVTGLDAATRYFYNIGDTAGVLSGDDENHYFETSPIRGTASATRIWVVGDSGTANSNSVAVYNAYRSFTGSTYTNMMLMLGDNAYDNGTDAEYQAAVFNTYPEILRQTPLWPTLGNHDGHSADSATQSGPYYDIFSLPRNAEVGGIASGTEAYYSYDYGNIHFVVLDSYETSRSTSGAMMSWLQTDLQNVTSDWLIAIWHHPPYTKGSHNSDNESTLIDMRENFLPVLESYGVDLVLNGHSHSYERSKFIDGHYGSSGTFNSSHEMDAGSGRIDGTGAYVKNGSQPNTGTVYAVNGASGKISGGNLNHPAMYTSLNQLGSMVLDFNGQTLDVKYLNNTGNVTDYFTITKDTTPPTPPAAPSDFTANADSSSTISLGWSDQSSNETGFEIERSLDGTNWNQIAVAGFNSTHYTDTGLISSTNYFYRVRSTNTAGSANYSNTASATTNHSSPIETVILQDGVNNYTGTQDSYVGSGVVNTNWGSLNHFDADGADGGNGELVALIQWNVSSIPATANVSDVELSLEVFNLSPGSYGLYAMSDSWNEDSVTWSNANINTNQGELIATLDPNSTGSFTVSLNSAGVDLVQGWIDGTLANYGLMIRSTGTIDGVDMCSSEYATVSERPALTITYETGMPIISPAAPSALEAIAPTHDSINLAWTDNSDNETGFDIECSVDESTWVLVGSMGANTTTYADFELLAQTIYYYRVSAKNSVGNSVYSNVANATTQDSNDPVSINFRNGLNGYTGTQDSYVASGNNSNYGGAKRLKADGYTRKKGELVSLLQWDVSSIPTGSVISQASITITVSNRSRGSYGIYAMNDSWNESSITWNNANVNTNQGTLITSISPSTTGSYTLTLDSAGIALVQGWIDGATANNGVLMRTTGTKDGMVSYSSEYRTSSQRPTLSITYQ